MNTNAFSIQSIVIIRECARDSSCRHADRILQKERLIRRYRSVRMKQRIPMPYAGVMCWSGLIAARTCMVATGRFNDTRPDQEDARYLKECRCYRAGAGCKRQCRVYHVPQRLYYAVYFNRWQEFYAQCRLCGLYGRGSAQTEHENICFHGNLR